MFNAVLSVWFEITNKIKSICSPNYRGANFFIIPLTFSALKCKMDLAAVIRAANVKLSRRTITMEEIRQIWCEEDQKYYPEIKAENGSTYKLDPQTFVYLEQLNLGLTEEEQALMSEDIGKYGSRWREYMEEFHPEVIPSLQGRLKWELIPRQVDKEAFEYRMLLRKQYEKQNPRPTTFNELIVWENTLGMLIDRAIMEDIVLIYRD